MELALLEARLVSFRSVAASLGGVEDRGVGMADETQRTLLTGIKRVGLAEIESENFTESINKRMSLYHDIARQRGARIKAYINVGGGVRRSARRWEKDHGFGFEFDAAGGGPKYRFGDDAVSQREGAGDSPGASQISPPTTVCRPNQGSIRRWARERYSIAWNTTAGMPRLFSAHPVEPVCLCPLGLGVSHLSNSFAQGRRPS